MEKKKKIILISVIMAIVFIVSLITVFCISYQKDKKQIEKNKDQIIEKYQTFKSEMEEYGSLRSTLYDTVFKAYLNVMKENYSSDIEKLKEYENKVIQIEENNKDLDKLCKIIYLNEEVDHKCEAFRLSYEQMNNYLIKDIKRFNDNIEKYNEWKDESNENLEMYKLQTERDYIDYNQDGTYFGKE